MLRGFASRCLEPVSPRAGRSSRERVKLLANSVTRRTYERRRRSGDGRKRDAFEERSAANQEEYFRKETARQLQELRERLKRKADNDAERDGVKRRRASGQTPDKNSTDDSDPNREN